jgi:allantoin racemase
VRIVIVNVNTTEAITESVRRQAAAVAASGTQIDAVTPFFGPTAVEGYFGSYISAAAVLDRVAAVTGDYDAVIEAGFGESAQAGLQEMVDVPVISITEAAAHLACLLGHRYSVVTTVNRAVRQISERLLVAGLNTRCASIRATGLGVLDLDRDAGLAMDKIAEAARLAVAEDGAEAICLGCAGMVDLRDRVAAAVDVPVIDGVAAAVKLAEAMHALRLRPRPAEKPSVPPEIVGWPLHRHLNLGTSPGKELSRVL